MTTERDDLKDREERFGTGFTQTQGMSYDAFGDPSKQFPRKTYENQSGVNEAIRSGKTHRLRLGADIELPPVISTVYPHSDVKETVSGHVFEFNDTPGGERILIKHNSGAGVELLPDGTVVVLATSNKVEVTHGDQKVIVEGNGTLTYEGDLNLNVKGDFNVNCNSFDLTAKNDKTETIQGHSRTKVFGNEGKTVSGNSSNTVVGSTVNTHLGNVTTAIKGNNKQATEGSHIIAASDKLELTAATRIIQSSPKMNLQATEMYVWGDGGTIGGLEMRIHGQGAHFSEGVTAPAFWGDLQGTAVRSITADVTNSQNYSDPDTDPGSAGNTGSAAGYTADDTEQPPVYTAPSGILKSVLEKSELGVKKVKVDIDDFLKTSLRTRVLEEGDVRSKLRDPINLANPDFTAKQVGAGTLNPSFASTSPPNGFGRIRNAGGNCQRGTVTVGNASTSPQQDQSSPNLGNTVTVAEAEDTDVTTTTTSGNTTTTTNTTTTGGGSTTISAPEGESTPPPFTAYDPASAPPPPFAGFGDADLDDDLNGWVPRRNSSSAAKTFRVKRKKKVFKNAIGGHGPMDNKTHIGTGTKLIKKIRFARFINANDAGAFKHLSLADKKAIGHNYIEHATLTDFVNGVDGQFANHRLKVIEGFYAKEIYGREGPNGLETEELTPDGILDLRSKGRAVVYELHDSKGSDLDATYELACALAEIGKFDKLTLDYDTFAPDGSLNVQIIIELPNYVGETATYDGVVETKYNNALQASDSLVEIAPPSTGPQ
tara:strand:+ start:51447 stop:53750 length:2304 start_codon:yes stop_codon:yes gene_type:complete